MHIFMSNARTAVAGAKKPDILKQIKEQPEEQQIRIKRDLPTNKDTDDLSIGELIKQNTVYEKTRRNDVDLRIPLQPEVGPPPSYYPDTHQKPGGWHKDQPEMGNGGQKPEKGSTGFEMLA